MTPHCLYLPASKTNFTVQTKQPKPPNSNYYFSAFFSPPLFFKINKNVPAIVKPRDKAQRGFNRGFNLSRDEEDGVRFFSAVPNERRKCNKQKMKHQKFHLNTWNFFYFLFFFC